jgi:hypothetical protein
VLVVLVVALVGLWKPGPIPRYWFLLPVGIFIMGVVVGQGSRWISTARFDVAALPAFMLVGYWLATRPKLAIAGCCIMMCWQLHTAYHFTRGVWTG